MTLRNFKYCISGCLLFFLFVQVGCSGDDDAPPVPPSGASSSITINPTTTHQEMTGFGGAITWYCNRVTASSNETQINNLMFQDLGVDIIRVKNWYYPDGYPTVKTTDVMTDDFSKPQYDATNEIVASAKAANPNVKILLSSWGPPAALKSNNSSREGTLKKDGSNAFMYDAFGDYWVDVLDHTPFNPDYISIQNEPSYINAGWTTCEWAATETATLPGYDQAFDKVYSKISGRANPPIMVAPESANIGQGANGNTFSVFAEAIKNKAHLGVYGYHPYNFNSGSSSSQIISLLEMVKSYNTKPNWMTEYSDNFDWFNTAIFINRTLVNANSSGYIYWKLIWATPTSGTDAGMVSINDTGGYTVTPFYYVIKHFSKYVDAGYRRIGATSTHASIHLSAFINPGQDKITVIVINPTASSLEFDLNITGKTKTAIVAYKSVSGNYYKVVPGLTATGKIAISGNSITTVSLDVN